MPSSSPLPSPQLLAHKLTNKIELLITECAITNAFKLSSHSFIATTATMDNLDYSYLHPQVATVRMSGIVTALLPALSTILYFQYYQPCASVDWLGNLVDFASLIYCVGYRY